MAVIKVESFDVDVANGSTHTLTNDVGSLSSAFVRRPGPSDKASGGPTGSTANTAPDDAHMGVEMTATDTLTFRAGSSVTRKIMGEVWRYTGSSGPDEFICRGHEVVTVTSGVGSTTPSGIVNRNKCVPFITGVSTTVGSNSDYELTTFTAYIDGSGNLQVLGVSGANATVYVDVVEFTGTNWTVGHAISSNHDTTDETVTLNTDSTGTGGTTFSVPNQANAIFEISMQGDAGGETGLSDVLATTVFSGSSLSDVIFQLHQDGDSAARNDGDAYIHVFCNPNLSVYRNRIDSIAEGNGTYGTAAWPTGAPTTASLDELALEWMVDTTGAGTAHARGRLNARITAASGTIQHWVHRQGNDVDVQYGVVDLTNVLDIVSLVITDVDGDNIVSNTQTNVNINGADFEAVQGTGTVTLTQNADGSGTTVSQTVNTWSDTQVNIDITAGALADTNCYLRLVNDSGSIGVIAIQVGVPPLSYTEVVESLSPDHYWILDNSYVDEIAALNWSVRTGSPSFTTNPLTRGRTNSWTVTATGQEAGPSNSTNMNDGTTTTRTMGGWIRISEIQSSFVMFYEEGGGINNIAFFMGIGGILIAQLADTGDDNVHAYSDFRLQPNRDYHIAFRFDYTQPLPADRRFELFVDGVLQSSTFGNPLTSTNLDSHTGDIAFGDSGDSLEVFGTDINFPSAVTTYYQDWATWTTYISEADVRSKLFVQGVRPEVTISSDTEANMQTDIDTYASTIRNNAACNFEIKPSTDGDFELDFDNIIFDDLASIHILYQGVDTLTIIKTNGSNPSKVETPNGGTVVFVEAVPITFTVLDATTLTEIQGVRVRVEAGATGPLAQGTEIVEALTDVNGQVTTNLQYSADQSIEGTARKGTSSPVYVGADFTDTVGSSGLSRNILLVPDE